MYLREVRVRKIAPIVVAIVLGASCIPWFRRQNFFTVIASTVVVALTGIMVFRGMALCTEKWQRWRKGDLWKSGRLPRRVLILSLEITLFLVLVLTVPHYLATGSGAYKLAVSTARQTPQFTEILGAPVREAWFSEGEEVWGNPAKADLLIPVQGRKRHGHLRALAIKEDGRWRLRELSLELTRPDQRINLLSR